jgi:hypothetical protein
LSTPSLSPSGYFDTGVSTSTYSKIWPGGYAATVTDVDNQVGVQGISMTAISGTWWTQITLSRDPTTVSAGSIEYTVPVYYLP